ncbi:hypothetical protein C8R47DRAFT_1070786 [Mycena vitilis]|nr:hypothetical protein C8R47DRAFT_1070786 [Mycena vitilis]
MSDGPYFEDLPLIEASQSEPGALQASPLSIERIEHCAEPHKAVLFESCWTWCDLWKFGRSRFIGKQNMRLHEGRQRKKASYNYLGNQTLQGVAMVSRHLDSIHGPRLTNDLLSAWPKLFDYTSPPLDMPTTLDPAPSELKARYISATIAVFSLYTSHPALFHMSAENKDTPTNLLVARLWYWKVKGIDPPIPSSIIPLFRAFLNSNHLTPDTRCVTLGFAVSIPSITTCTWNPDEVDFPELTRAISLTVRLLLDTPGAELTAPSPNLSLVEAHLGMIVALSRAPRLAFMNHHSSTTATKTLLALSNLSTSTSNAAIIAKCVSLCVEHLCIVLEAAAGLNPILEALDAMLLPILVKCYAHRPQLNTIAATKHNVASLLAIVLSKHLIFIPFANESRAPLPLSLQLDLKASWSRCRPSPSRSEAKVQRHWETHRHAAPAPVVLLDYTTHPPGFVTMTADARRMPYKQSKPRQALFWRETVEMVDAARKRGIDQGIIEIYITAGATPYSTSVPITLNELRTR